MHTIKTTAKSNKQNVRLINYFRSENLSQGILKEALTEKDTNCFYEKSLIRISENVNCYNKKF